MVFLIENYSARTFFQLYRTVRQDSFRDDIESVLGIKWPDLEAEFWQWLVTESRKISRSGQTKFALKFERGCDPKDWDALMARFQQTPWTRAELPRDVGLKIETRGVAAATGAAWDHSVEAVLEGGDGWVRVHQRDKTDRVLAIEGHECLEIDQSDAGDWNVRFSSMEYKGTVRGEILDLLALGADPSKVLPLESHADLLFSTVRYRLKSMILPSHRFALLERAVSQRIRQREWR